MSAPSCVAFVGFRFSINEAEIEALEERRDTRQLEARAVGLKSCWGNFGADPPRYALFVGSQLGVFGLEGNTSLCIAEGELARLTERTRTGLAATTMTGEVALSIEDQPG